MKRWVAAMTCAALPMLPAAAVDVDLSDAVLLADDALPALTAATLDSWPALAGKLRFTFQGDGKDRAVWLGGNRDFRRTDVRAFDFPVYEIQAAFRPDGGALAQLELVLFSRGDVVQSGAKDGPLAGRIGAAVHDDKAFKELVAAARERIEKPFGAPLDPRPRNTSRVDNHDQRQFVWKAPGGEIRLAVGLTKENKSFRGEYIRVAVRPADPAAAAPPLAAAGTRPADGRNEAKITANRADVAKNVVHRPDGLVFVDNIPMVDQGDKGYCAVATLERLIRYYGGTANQHELAQLADTGDGGGTMVRRDRFVSPEVCRQFGFKQETVKVEHPDPERLLKAYNKLAPVKLEADKKSKNADFGLLLERGDPATLRAAAADLRETRKFVPEVKKYVDKGVPLVWEIPGHIRLLIGYDEAAGLIAYSDSWGAGHELKTMPVAEALLLTEGLFAVRP